MGNLKIQYCFKLPDDSHKTFHLEIDDNTIEIIENVPANPPLWTKLDFYQCPNCEQSFYLSLC